MLDCTDDTFASDVGDARSKYQLTRFLPNVKKTGTGDGLESNTAEATPLCGSSARMPILILVETVTFLPVHGGTVTVVGVATAEVARAGRKSNQPPLNSNEYTSHRSDPWSMG